MGGPALGFAAPFSTFSTHDQASQALPAEPHTDDDLQLSHGQSLDDEQRDMRKLKKRLRQIEELERKVDEGERLDEKQQSKLRSKDRVLRHIADLEDRLQLRHLSGIDSFTEC